MWSRIYFITPLKTVQKLYTPRNSQSKLPKSTKIQIFIGNCPLSTVSVVVRIVTWSNQRQLGWVENNPPLKFSHTFKQVNQVYKGESPPPQHNQHVVQWRLTCPLTQSPLTWLYHYKHSNKAFTHSTHTTKTSIEYKPHGYDIYTRAIPTTSRLQILKLHWKGDHRLLSHINQ